MPSELAAFLVGLVQLVALATPPVVVAVTLVLRRLRLVGVFAVTRMVTGHEVPLDVLAAIALGAVVGSAALLLVGRQSLRPARRQLVEALGRSGLEVASLEHAGCRTRPCGGPWSTRR